MNSIGSMGKMKLSNCGSLVTDPARKRQCFCNLILAATLLCLVFFMGSALVAIDYEEKLSTWGAANSAETNQTDSKTKLNLQNTPSNSCEDVSTRGAASPVQTYQKKSKTKLNLQNTQSNLCESQHKPTGSEPLPKDIISQTSNFEMQPLGGSTETKGKSKSSKSLLAIPVGIKQKEVVNQIVKKFPLSDFMVMLFHYDGVVDEWRDLQWSYSALHISAINQTKWWFAKRFLHPDIVAEYNYIFLWDEDLGVTNFHPLRYLSIIKREGLEISQPALDTSKSDVHHRITARWRKGDVHRRIYKSNSGGRCNENSTSPPCTGWVEMMAPVFSRVAWRCAWHMIQNDLIHAWGLDMKLGYCAQGDRSKNVGVVDSEYIVHKGIPTLGGFDEGKVHPGPRTLKDRVVVRKRSYIELEIFRKRWQRAVTEDKCWIDPYSKPSTNSSH